MFRVSFSIMIVISYSCADNSSYKNSGRLFDGTHEGRQNITSELFPQNITQISKQLQEGELEYPIIDIRFMSEDVLRSSWFNNRKINNEAGNGQKISNEEAQSKTFEKVDHETNVNDEQFDEDRRKSLNHQKQETNSNSDQKIKIAYKERVSNLYSQNAASNFKFNHSLFVLIALYVYVQ